jgi:hypothetical protein
MWSYDLNAIPKDRAFISWNGEEQVIVFPWRDDPSDIECWAELPTPHAFGSYIIRFIRRSEQITPANYDVSINYEINGDRKYLEFSMSISQDDNGKILCMSTLPDGVKLEAGRVMAHMYISADWNTLISIKCSGSRKTFNTASNEIYVVSLL